MLGQQTQHLDEKASESRNIRGFDYDHHFISSADALFHTDYMNLTLRVVHILIGKLSEIPHSMLVGGRDPVDKQIKKGSLRGVWDLLLRNLVPLQRNIMNIYSEK